MLVNIYDDPITVGGAALHFGLLLHDVVAGRMEANGAPSGALYLDMAWVRVS